MAKVTDLRVMEEDVRREGKVAAKKRKRKFGKKSPKFKRNFFLRFSFSPH